MEPSWDADSLVLIRSENVNKYKHNFLRQVVCELRFPTLMELGLPTTPSSLVKALRKEYPYLNVSNEVTLGIATGATDSNHAHIFRSSKLNWTLTLKQSSLSIETTSYTEYDQLKDRVLRAIDAVAPVIDTDFFTRVGLRYINVVDAGEEDLNDGWINNDLIMPLIKSNFQNIQDYAGRLHLGASDGGCLLQHGIQFKSNQVADSENPQYILDIDTFRNEVMFNDVSVALNRMHEQAFNIFDWSIDEKARVALTV